MTDTRPTTLSRRKLLAGAGVLGAGVLVSSRIAEARSGPLLPSGPRTESNPSGLAPSPRAPSAQDVQVAQLAAGLEVLAVGAYTATLDAATAGAIGTVPPAVAEFVSVARQHHQDHLDAWNEVLTTNGAAAITQPDATLKPTVDAAFADVTDVVGAANLALTLEQIAAATYLNAQQVLTDADAVKLAGSIQIVDAQHVAVLLFVLGRYPVPDTFAKVDQSAWRPGAGAPAGSMPATR